MPTKVTRQRLDEVEKAMKPGRYSDGDRVRISAGPYAGRTGVIACSFGHWAVSADAPRIPDPAVGPRYAVALADTLRLEKGRAVADEVVVQDEDLAPVE